MVLSLYSCGSYHIMTYDQELWEGTMEGTMERTTEKQTMEITPSLNLL